jgi:hypothetical protein
VGKTKFAHPTIFSLYLHKAFRRRRVTHSLSILDVRTGGYVTGNLWKWIKRSALGVPYAEKAAFFVRKICAFFRLFEKKLLLCLSRYRV